MTAIATAGGRTKRVLKQTAFGLGARAGALLASFVAMPLMLRFLGPEALGVWLVLLSVFQWITFFDLGVAAGARNCIARAAATNDREQVRRAIATGWLYTALIALGLLCLTVALLAFSPFAGWLRVRAFNGVPAGAALWLVAIGSCVSFALSYVQSVYAALEKASAFSVFSLLSNIGFVVSLAAVFSARANGSVLQIGALYLLSMIGANLWLIGRFLDRHPELRPRLADIDHRLRPQMLAFGLRLFVVQVAAMVIFTTSRLMASVLLGPASVVVYDAAFKLFSTILIAHTLLMSTLWSSFTQAYENRELAWIRTNLRRLLRLMLPLSVACALMAAIAPQLITLWLGPAQVGPWPLYAAFAVMTVLSCWSNIFSYFLNGVGHTTVQLYTAVIAAALNIPACYFFAVSLKQGISGLLIGTCISLMLFAVAGPVKAFRMLASPAPS